MNRNKYSLLHRTLLFHWTQPSGVQKNSDEEDAKKFIPKPTPQNMTDRLVLISHLKSILTEGLRYSCPKGIHEEKITDLIQTRHRLISLSEWNVGASSEHARRYGHIGLGFTRKYIMSHDGRPVIYLRKSEKDNDPMTEAMIKLLNSALKDHDLRDHAQLIASLLKLSKDPRKPKKSDDDSRKSKSGSPPDEDHNYALQFGGIHGNLEDREWRILDPSSPDCKPRALPCEPGKLAMIVLPDHKTLTLALKDECIREIVLNPEKPAVCVISREMLYSI
jgi:hypothetical protein